ncbi:DNA cytosine methyltransferase [Marinifilum sp.]|uniref:DNA cytosine methyltransferase n=1 Tax=Marinifilum sp. TaxID=2033137 RepID=UPI003BA96372
MSRSNKIISLFSGGGFLDLGFINNGFKIERAHEIHEPFIDAYNASLNSYFEKSENFFVKSKISFHNPITQAADLSSANIQNELRNEFHGISGIIGGPPCQDFSIGGSNLGMDGERGKLIFAYSNIVNKVRPSFIFFENVEGLIKTRRHKIGFDSLLRRLKSYGYCVWYKVLNSLEYGIPQDRPRIALVGFKREIVEILEANGYRRKIRDDYYSDQLVFRFPKGNLIEPKSLIWPKKWKFGSDIIEDEIELIPKEYRCLFVEEVFKSIKNDDPNQNEHFIPKSNKFQFIEEGDTNRKSFKRLHRYRFSPTVAYGNNEVHLHPTLPRRLSVREALRLQSVPDEYVLPSSVPLTHKFKLIGNGVPVRKAELIAREIRRTLNIYERLR